MIKYIVLTHIILAVIATIAVVKSGATKLQITSQTLIAIFIPFLGPLFIKSLHAKEKYKGPDNFPPPNPGQDF